MTAKTRPRIVLASASPRRRDLLVAVGLQPVVRPAAIDETQRPGEAPRDLVARLARAKSESVAAGLRDDGVPGFVLAADTAVVVDGRALGKPADPEEACSMLRALRGRRHEVMTGVWLRRSDDSRSTGGVAVTGVVFRDFDDAWVEAYTRSGEPMDKAGAYAIQGAGALLVESIDGSWSNVVGLPLERLPHWVHEIGFSLLALLDWGATEDQASEVNLS